MKEKRSLFLSVAVTSYHFRSGGSNHPPSCAQVPWPVDVFLNLSDTILILFLGIARVGRSESRPIYGRRR